MDFIKDGTKKNIEGLLSKSVPDDISEHLSAEVIFTGDLSEIIVAHAHAHAHAHAQGNKVASFNGHIYEGNGIQCFRVKISSEVGEKKYYSGMGRILLTQAGSMPRSKIL